MIIIINISTIRYTYETFDALILVLIIQYQLHIKVRESLLQLIFNPKQKFYKGIEIIIREFLLDNSLIHVIRNHYLSRFFAINSFQSKTICSRIFC